MRLVLLDACRDNPFARTIKRSVASRSIGRGLAKVEPEPGTLVVYAAKHGEVALDGDRDNSPFAKALMQNMMNARPGDQKAVRPGARRRRGDDQSAPAAVPLRLGARPGRLLLRLALTTVRSVPNPLPAPQAGSFFWQALHRLDFYSCFNWNCYGNSATCSSPMVSG